jgi:hypothetical protein
MNKWFNPSASITRIRLFGSMWVTAQQTVNSIFSARLSPELPETSSIVKETTYL